MSLTRRSVIAGMSAVTTGGLARAQDARLVVRTTGGAFEAALKKHYFEPFTRSTGIRVIPVAASAAEMLTRTAAMQSAKRVEWDLISPQYDELANYAHLLEDLGECSNLPNIAAYGVSGTCHRYGALYLTGGHVLAYNKSAFPQGGPTTWADFWNVEKFPGARTMSNTGNPVPMLVFALVADGVPRDQLFPLDVDRALRKLQQIKPHIAVWWKSGDQSQQVFRSNTVQIGHIWSGRAYALKKQGVPLSWTYKDAMADFGAWALVKGAPNREAALKFLNFYIQDPRANADFAKEMGYATANRESAKLLDQQERQDLVTTQEQFDQIIHIDAKWAEQNRARVTELWNQWISS